MRDLKLEPYSQKEAEAAAGLGTYVVPATEQKRGSKKDLSGTAHATIEDEMIAD